MKFRRLARFAPLVAVTAAGCFATRSDVRLLQSDIMRVQQTLDSTRAADARSLAALRASQMHNDSVSTASQHDFMVAIGAIADTVHSVSEQLGRNRANTAESLHDISDRLLNVYAAMGATQKQMADMQAATEARQDRTTASDTGSRNAQPGPRQLYSTGLEQLKLGRISGARDAFNDFITRNPTDALVPTAMVYLAETYARDQDAASADSIYQLVVEKYPKSPAAPTALFKRAEALFNAGRPAEAKKYYKKIVDDYPKSDEKGFAADRLKNIPPH
jgi:tol-pal system protein YbgF